MITLNKLSKPIKYDSFNLAFIEKLYQIFNRYSQSVNEKHKQYISDRDRFVKKLFSKYVNKHFILIDKIPYLTTTTIGDKTYATILYDEKSIYYYDKDCAISMQKHNTYNRAEKRYLTIASFTAINTLFGNDYIQVTCFDTNGVRHQYELSHNNLLRMQFKEIEPEIYHAVSSIFADTRKDEKFKITYSKVEEGVRKYKKRIKTVAAKDYDDARNKFEADGKIIFDVVKKEYK